MLCQLSYSHHRRVIFTKTRNPAWARTYRYLASVGVTVFETATFRTRTGRSTKLSYTP